MKKLLTIVALALVLCLGVSAVLADGETQRKEMGVKFGDAFTNGSAAFVAAVNASRAGEALIGGHRVTTSEVDVQSALANALANAAHAEYTIITLYGQKLKEENNATYQLITDADKLVVGKTYYIQSVDKDGKVQKDDKGNVKYEALKDSAELGKVYDKTDNYQYTNDGYESFNVRVMVTPHDKNGTPKTVTKEGKEMIVYTCSVCGKEWDPQAKADPATCKHENWGWVTVVEATCLKEGKQQYQCLDCGKTEGRTAVIVKKNHNFKDYELNTLVAPHCVANDNGVGTVVNGYVYATCTVCGSRAKRELGIGDYRKILEEELGWTAYEASGWTCHDYSLKATSAPTCDSSAYNTYICSICHYSYRSYFGNPLSANYILTSAPNCKTIKAGDEIIFKCSNCGSASMNHPAITVKVTKGMIEDLKVLPEVRVTASKTLVQTYKYYMALADGTGEAYVKEETVEADVTATGYLNHSGALKQVDEKKAYIAGRPGVKVEDAVCGDTILNKWQCSVCESKEIVKKVKDITHVWGEYKAVLDTGTLKKWQRACTICGQPDDAIYSEEAPDKACKEGNHDYHPLYAADARCNNLRAVIDAFETVKIELVCSICGDQKTDYWTIEHEWELVPGSSKPATCEEEGFNAYECAICHQVCVESVALADHELVAVAEKPATCKEAGYEAYWKCSVCGDLFADEDGEEWLEEIVVLPIDKEAHVWDEGKETVKPTTETEGEKTFTCTICGATKTEKVAKLTPAAAYTLENVKFSGNILSGSIKHKDGTKVAEKLSIRVTFFTAGNNYMTTTATIYADGTFEAEGAGDIEAITLVAYATDKVVNPADVANLTKLDAKEIIVK